MGSLSAHINPIIMQCARNHLIASNPEGDANDTNDGNNCAYIGLQLHQNDYSYA